MTAANIITLLRVVLVPVIIWCLLRGSTQMAFVLFVLAGLSDAIDGAVARMLNQQSDLGVHLDPIADKTMLVSVFVVLGYLGHIPLWLVILVVSRDIVIVAGVMIAFFIGKPVTVKPLAVSKINTAVQIFLACLVMGYLAFEIEPGRFVWVMVALTGFFTAISAAAYFVQWTRHLTASEETARQAGDGEHD